MFLLSELKGHDIKIGLRWYGLMGDVRQLPVFITGFFFSLYFYIDILTSMVHNTKLFGIF
jgi:hypothetical protein